MFVHVCASYLFRKFYPPVILFFNYSLLRCETWGKKGFHQACAWNQMLDAVWSNTDRWGRSAGMVSTWVKLGPACM